MLTKKARYELDYWRQNMQVNNREKYLKYLKLWNLSKASSLGDVLEVGSGPLCGCLPYVQADSKTSIDPLWKIYQREGLANIPDDVAIVNGKIENIDRTELKGVMFDVILSANALDHGKKGYKAFSRISEHLKPNGLFFLHVHLRTIAELNEGHNHALSLQSIQEIAKGCGLRECWISNWPSDPVEQSQYHTLIGKWQKENSHVVTK